MNKRAEINLDNPVGAIIGLFVFMLFGVIAVIILSTMSNVVTQDQCKPIQEKADQLQIQVNSDQLIINQTNNILEQCRANYSELINQNITRKDFEEIKGYFNLTRNDVSTINKKIDGIDRIYNLYNINIKNYSFAFNIILSIEILSFILVKNEFLQWVWSLTFGRKKKKQKESEEVKV